MTTLGKTALGTGRQDIARLCDQAAARALPFGEAVIATVAVAVAAWIALLSLVYVFLAYPQADDLERTAAMRFLSPFERMWSDYNHIDGRWASLLIQYYSERGDHVTSL